MWAWCRSTAWSASASEAVSLHWFMVPAGTVLQNVYERPSGVWTTSTGQWAWATTAELTEPSSRPPKPP
jgi:hypothetical protein